MFVPISHFNTKYVKKKEKNSMGLGLKTLVSLLNASMVKCGISQFSIADSYLMMMRMIHLPPFFIPSVEQTLQMSQSHALFTPWFIQCFHCTLFLLMYQRFHINQLQAILPLATFKHSFVFSFVRCSWAHINTLGALYFCLATLVYSIWRDTHAHIRKTRLHIWVRRRTVCGR